MCFLVLLVSFVSSLCKFPGYIVMTVDTTAFSAVFAVQREKVSMTSKSGFEAGFLEKTFDEWWSKQVVVVK